MDNGAAAGADTSATSSVETQVKYEPFLIIAQDVQLDFNFVQKQVKGNTTLKIFKLDDNLEYITLDARQCQIDTNAITVNKQKVKAEYTDPYRLLNTPEGYTWGARQHHLRTNRMKPLQPPQRPQLPMEEREKKGCQPAIGSLRIWLRPESRNTIKVVRPPQTPGVSAGPSDSVARQTYEVFIPFESTHVRDGLQFVGTELKDERYPHAYTRHSVEPGYASCIFPCVDDRTRVNHWTISLKIPRTVLDAFRVPGEKHLKPVRKMGKDRVPMTMQDKLLDMTAVCSGTLVGEHEDAEDVNKKVMTFEVKFCGAQHIGFAIGPFEDVDLFSAFRSEEDEAKLAGNAIKIHGYCLPKRRDDVCNTCQPLASAADYFTLTFSKYPYEDNSYKICFVDDMVDDTAPLQGFSLVSSRLLYPEEIIDPELDVTRKVVHTLASQYFGVFINPNELTDTWIVVGLAYYMTDMYIRKLAGNNYYRFQMRVLAEHLTQVDHGRPALHDLGRHLALGDFEMQFMALKAPLVMFILDRRLMKSSNSSGVTRVISQRVRDAMQSPDTGFAKDYLVSSEQFRRQCEKKGRLRLEEFWDQWVRGSGCPRFHVTQRFNKKRLEVEVTVIQNQVKWSQEPHQLDKHDFWRDIMEERHSILASEVPLTFTGPMTFRVHEADGTPYEHCLEIKLDAAATKGSRLSMPYNTKYKRIKRTRQNKRAKASARDPDRMDEDGNDDDDDKGHTLNTFGDVLVNDDDMNSWKLVDWDDDMQAQMDQESYEWIRVDCDFEWIYNLETNFKVYMTVAQLQQDRDVAGQVESMLTLTRNQPSNIQTTMLLRTLYDSRYFYGIRTMAANALTRHAEPANNFRGMHHLMRVFKRLFCFHDTTAPRPNDFSNKKEYYVQAAIPMALAKIRGGQPFCPEEARKLILDQLIYNNNEGNTYSDQFYVAKLLEALATSLVKVDTDHGIQSGVPHEVQVYLEKALDQIERYEKMDGWVHTYKNIWVVAALDCKMKLMKSGMIPVDPATFLKYALTQNYEDIVIKAFEALVELGLLLRPSIMKLLLAEIGTNNSPYVRDQLFKVLTRGLAAIAFGELEVADQAGQQRERNPKLIAAGQNELDGNLLMDDDDDDGDLIVEHSDDVIKRRQERIARQRDIAVAIKALKETVQNDENFQKHLWQAIDSPIIGLAEQRNLLELCATLFPTEDEMMVTMKYPTRWKVSYEHQKPARVRPSTPLSRSVAANVSQKLLVNFTRVVRTKRKRDEAFPVEPVAAPAAVTPAPVRPIAPVRPAAPARPMAPVAPVVPVVPAALPAAPVTPAAPVAHKTPKPVVPAVPGIPASSEREKDKDRPKSKVIKLSRSGTFSKNAGSSSAPSPAPIPRQPSVAASTPRQPSVAVSTPRQPSSVAVSTPRPTELERSKSIAVQNRPVAKPTTAEIPAASSSTPDPSRPIIKAKSAKPKKRKHAQIPGTIGPHLPNSLLVTMRFRFDKLKSAGQLLMMSMGPSQSRRKEATPADSITASARTVDSASSQLPPRPPPAKANTDSFKASFTSTLSAGSSSQPPASHRTPLSNGKQRKPLPSGTAAGSSPAKPTPTHRSVSQAQSNQALFSSVSPSASRSSAEPGQPKRKIIKLKLGSRALLDAASGTGSSASSQARSSFQASPAPSQARTSGETDKA